MGRDCLRRGSGGSGVDQAQRSNRVEAPEEPACKWKGHGV